MPGPLCHGYKGSLHALPVVYPPPSPAWHPLTHTHDQVLIRTSSTGRCTCTPATTHHHVLCRGVTTGDQMSSWTVYGYRYARLLCMVVSHPQPSYDGLSHTSYPRTPSTLQEDTHTHTLVTPIDLHETCSWLVHTPPLHRDGYAPSTF